MWSDDLLTVHFDPYGLVIDSYPVYLSLSWAAITVLILSVVGYKIYKKVRERK